MKYYHSENYPDGVNLYDLFRAGVLFAKLHSEKQYTEAEWYAALDAALPTYKPNTGSTQFVPEGISVTENGIAPKPMPEGQKIDRTAPNTIRKRR